MKDRRQGGLKDVKRHAVMRSCGHAVIFIQFFGFGWIQGQQLDAETLPRPFASYFFYD